MKKPDTRTEKGSSVAYLTIPCGEEHSRNRWRLPTSSGVRLRASWASTSNCNLWNGTRPAGKLEVVVGGFLVGAERINVL